MNIKFRKALRADVKKIVKLLADDDLGTKREKYTDPLPESYYEAFNSIDSDNNNYLLVAEIEKNVIGVLQLTIIPYLTYQGSKRATIEGVRVDKTMRGSGVGQALIKHAIDLAKQQDCHLVQLTTDKARTVAFEIYKKLGFVDSHMGMKFHITNF